MARPHKHRQYIFDERKLIIFERLLKGYSQVDVASMLNIDPSAVNHIVQFCDDEFEAFKSLKQKENERSK